MKIRIPANVLTCWLRPQSTRDRELKLSTPNGFGNEKNHSFFSIWLVISNQDGTLYDSRFSRLWNSLKRRANFEILLQYLVGKNRIGLWAWLSKIFLQKGRTFGFSSVRIGGNSEATISERLGWSKFDDHCFLAQNLAQFSAFNHGCFGDAERRNEKQSNTFEK